MRRDWQASGMPPEADRPVFLARRLLRQGVAGRRYVGRPRIERRRRIMKGLFWILLGAAVALWIAPRSGEATRREVFARVSALMGT
jgi:hypothetical protein